MMISQQFSSLQDNRPSWIPKIRVTIKKPNIKRLKGSTGRTFTWDGNVMFHKTSGQITVQQLKILIERLTLGAKICRTYSLACPASFVLPKRLNESENHLQLPSWGFLWQKKFPEWLWSCPPHGRPHAPAIWAERAEGTVRESTPGVCCSSRLQLVHGPSGAVAIWYYLVPGQAFIQPESEGVSQQLSTLLVYREETHCIGPSGLIWLELKSADPNLAKLPWISLSAYLSCPSGLGPRGTLIHKANKHMAKIWFRKI